ncbi:hypothetical protein EJ04DRAFT_582532 [Polyplosphaeria fusca]|uniref:Uncharacterized protein n=1 Tax=Polyplosphaeria fusca TaxID=682080 RepID=A0A9P4UU08_9PLEO|nr:hypothetical protein EJ04DRAFT_582532 [Polyplosphaeria fusca]
MIIPLFVHNGTVLSSPSIGAGNDTLPAPGQPPNTVSWQSAFWPLIAWMVTVIAQPTGRVSGLPYGYRAMVRCCPLICAFDAFWMVTTFLVLWLNAGCSKVTAARHVWYDRFGLDENAFWETTDNAEQAGLSTGRPESPDTTDEMEFQDALPYDPLPLTPLTVRTENPRNTTSVANENPQSSPIEESPYESEQITEAAPPGQSAQNGTAESLLRQFCDHNRSSIDLTDRPRPSIDNHVAEQPTEPTVSVIHNGTFDPEAAPLLAGEQPALLFYPGSAIDQTWRLSMLAFFLGTIPQTVKIYSMQGIICTQIHTALFLFGFLVPEVFRLAAGAAGQFNLCPLPRTINLKSDLACGGVLITMILSLPISMLIITFLVLPILRSVMDDCGKGGWFDYTIPGNHGPGLAIVASFSLAILPTILILKSRRLVGNSRIFLEFVRRNAEKGWMQRLITNYSRVSTYTASILAVERAPFLIGPCSLLYAFIVFTFALFQICTGWDGFLLPGRLWQRVPWYEKEPLMIIGLLIWGVDAIVESGLMVFWGGLFTYQLLFRVLLVGRFSHYPRKFTGLNGAADEFLSGIGIFAIMLSTLLAYTFKDKYGTEFWVGTFKPSWTEWLG